MNEIKLNCIPMHENDGKWTPKKTDPAPHILKGAMVTPFGKHSSKDKRIGIFPIQITNTQKVTRDFMVVEQGGQYWGAPLENNQDVPLSVSFLEEALGLNRTKDSHMSDAVRDSKVRRLTQRRLPKHQRP
ncbi:MAG: hypothetical protein AAF988_04610 [Pseudomonadota bacterium]